MAGFFDKLSDVINNTADEITDKAKEMIHCIEKLIQ